MLLNVKEKKVFKIGDTIHNCPHHRTYQKPTLNKRFQKHHVKSKTRGILPIRSYSKEKRGDYLIVIPTDLD